MSNILRTFVDVSIENFPGCLHGVIHPSGWDGVPTNMRDKGNLVTGSRAKGFLSPSSDQLDFTSLWVCLCVSV